MDCSVTQVWSELLNYSFWMCSWLGSLVDINATEGRLRCRGSCLALSYDSYLMKDGACFCYAIILHVVKWSSFLVSEWLDLLVSFVEYQLYWNCTGENGRGVTLMNDVMLIKTLFDPPSPSAMRLCPMPYALVSQYVFWTSSKEFRYLLVGEKVLVSGILALIPPNNLWTFLFAMQMVTWIADKKCLLYRLSF